ncbi:CLUMA_CG016354, isoform A [Clunio marinus]|uniref:CLUMA_CG016354, isoform A n=1 Tax=Clunio marinus TaxID=568069 RepID=A0A1J1ISZ3_9DIPT|nr:CLUMA_CG016354, isoform A [Clunio marinus]
MTSSTCSNNSLKLICLHPNEFVNSFISPKFKTFPSKLHGTTSHPQEY